MADDYIRRQDVLNLPQNIERNLKGEIVERSVDVGAIEALPSADVVQGGTCQMGKLQPGYNQVQSMWTCNP